MIYFVQRHQDEYVTIGETENLQQVMLELERQFGKVELLGVMPGNSEMLDGLWQKFETYSFEQEHTWFVASPEMFDYIDEVATTDDANLKSSARYKSSNYTPIKQQALEAALRHQINLVVHITKKFVNYRRPYLYFDLNAGPGLTEEQQPGSPLIFKRVAEEYMSNWSNFRFEAFLYEAELQTYSRLVSVLGSDPRFTIEHNDHKALNIWLDKSRSIPFNRRKWVYGAVYADPSNASLPWELLEEMNDVYPHIDIMINIACASYKRTISMVGYQTLANRLPKIKDHWIVRRPFGKHQWSILIGSNWPDYPAWKEKEFYPWNDKGIGSDIFTKLVYTPDQIREQIQLKLWDD